MELEHRSDIEAGEPPKKIRKLTEDLPEDTSTEVTKSSSADHVIKNEEVNSGSLKDSVNENLLHPLLDIEHIIENVMKRLDLEDLKHSSLVCKTWCVHARKQIIKDKSICIAQETAEEILNQTTAPTDSTSIVYNIFGHSVCLFLRLTDHTVRPNEDNDPRVFIDFKEAERMISYFAEKETVIACLKLDFHSSDVSKVWTLLSTKAAHLNGIQLKSSRGPQVPNPSSRVRDLGFLLINRIFSQLQPPPAPAGLFWNQQDNSLSFPALKSLNGDFTRRSGVGIINLFRKLLIHSPNLEELNCEMSSNHHEMFAVLKENPGILQNLKHLSNVSLNKHEMEVLSDKNLGLEKLSFQLYSGFRVRQMDSFLSSLGKTLKVLKINFINIPTNADRFECGKDLVNLTDLTLEKFYGSIHFISHLPKLKSLVLINVNLSVAIHDDAINYNYTSKLKRLEIFGGQGSNGRFLLQSVYGDIVRFFPELKVLRIEYLTDRSVEILIQGLSLLEELYMPKGIYTDAVLVSKEYSAHSSKQISSLSELKHLRKLLLQSPRITDAGVYNGVVHYRELRGLSIDTPLISDSSLLTLCENSNLLSLKFLNCYRLSAVATVEAELKYGKGRSLIFKHC